MRQSYGNICRRHDSNIGRVSLGLSLDCAFHYRAIQERSMSEQRTTEKQAYVTDVGQITTDNHLHG